MVHLKPPKVLTKETAEEDVAAVIDAVKRSPGQRKQLVQYLRQEHPLYAGRSANEVIRIRGYMLEAFRHTGLPETALPFVLEVLEAERKPYLVAGAAMALRGLSVPPRGVAPYLLKAITNVRWADDS